MSAMHHALISRSKLVRTSRNRRWKVDDEAISSAEPRRFVFPLTNLRLKEARAQASNHDNHLLRISNLNTILLRRRNADTDGNEQSKSREAR